MKLSRLIASTALFLAFVLVSAAGTVKTVNLIANLADPSTATDIANAYSITLTDTAPGSPFVLFTVDQSLLSSVMSSLQSDPRVVWVEDELPFDSPESKKQRPQDIRSRVGGTIPVVFDTAHGEQYNKAYLDQIHWRLTPMLMASEKVVRVAILDTGLSPMQPVLWDKVVASEGYVGTGDAYDLPTSVDTNNNGLVDEGVGHGTFVMSIVATVAPYAKFVIAKVADSDGVATSWTILRGLVFAVDNGCEFANISLGSQDAPVALSDVLDWVQARGLTVIAAAGNDNKRRMTYPARYSKVISVTGIDENDVKASFSNYDSSAFAAGPSVLVAGAWWEGGAVGWSGTSFAAPFVTGCLADTSRRRGDWSPDQIKNLMRNTGVNIDPLNPSFTGQLGLRVDWKMLNDAQKWKRQP